jgi:hypothetical protein
MSTLFPHLFEPLSLRHKTLKHRLNFGAPSASPSPPTPPVCSPAAISATATTR